MFANKEVVVAPTEDALRGLREYPKAVGAVS